MDAIKYYVATLFITIVTASLCSAQQSRINLQQKIVVPATTIRFDSLLSVVSRQTGAKFSLNTSKFPPSRLVHVKKGPMPVAQLLASIHDDTGIYYTVLGGHIIFIDNPPRKAPAPPAKKETPVKKANEKLPLNKLSGKKMTVPTVPRLPWDLQEIPSVYFVPDTLLSAAAAIQRDTAGVAVAGIKRDSVKKVDAVRTTFASGTRYDSIKKVDAVRTTFASGTRYDSIKKEDSVRIPFASIKQTDSIKIAFERSTVKETEAPFIAASASADAVHYRLPRFSSWQLDPALHWGWGSGKDDTLIHKVVAVGATDSISKTTITKDNTPTAATKNKTQQSETTAATTSPNDKIKQTVTAIEKTSLIKSIMQNTFSNRYQKPGGQGVRMNNGQGPFSFLLNLGVTADEVYYANPTIQIGLPFLYGIASLSTNFNLVGARFGAGISAKLSDDWRLHLQGTTGRQLHYVDVGENNDSAGTHVRTGQVKSRILKFSLVAEKQLGERLRLQAGIVLNSQLLQYTMDDSTHTLSIAEMDQAYKQFNIIHAPYTISNTYGVNQNTKIWIGFQVGVFYNINFNKRK